MVPPTRTKQLFLDSTIFDLQADGGISRYWFELGSNFSRRYEDWDLTLHADPRTINRLGQRLIEVTKERQNVRLYTYLSKKTGRFIGPRLADEYKGFLWHSSYYRVPLRLGMPQVCTVHDFISERYFSGTYAWLQSRMKRRAIFKAQQIICPSEATKRDLLSFYPSVDASHCHVIYHGLSDAFTQAIEPAETPRPIDPYIMFVGSRAGYKNFRLTVLSVEAVPEMNLYVIGGKRLSNRELALLKTRLPNRHRIFEAPNDEFLRDLYRSATALAYLSKCEGFGFPPLEAMACGCPVIAMAASSIPEVVGNAGILLKSEDPGVVVEAVRAVRRLDFRLSLIKKGIMRAKQFTWDRAVDKTVAVYEQASSFLS